MRNIPDASAKSLVDFVVDAVEYDSNAITDSWSGYDGLPYFGYGHEIRNISASSEKAHDLLPNVHIVINLYKTLISGTHQGAVLSQHIQSYVEEFTFRFNRRNFTNRGLLFRRLLEHSILTKHVSYKDIAHGFNWKERRDY
jgi:hypothetical protein